MYCENKVLNKAYRTITFLLPPPLLERNFNCKACLFYIKKRNISRQIFTTENQLIYLQ